MLNTRVVSLTPTLLGLFCILIAAPLFASDVTLYGGMQRQGKLTLPIRNPGPFVSPAGSEIPADFNPRNFGVFGFRIGHGGLFGAEHTLALSPNFIESKTSAVIYNSNFRLEPSLPKVRPYGTAGAGFIFASSGGSADVGTRFAINYGGGLKVFPNGRNTGIRFDVRGYTMSVQPDRAGIRDQRLNIFEVSLGVVFSNSTHR